MSRALANVSGVCQQTLAGYAVKVSGVGWQKDDVKETGRERQYTRTQTASVLLKSLRNLWNESKRKMIVNEDLQF